MEQNSKTIQSGNFFEKKRDVQDESYLFSANFAVLGVLAVVSH